MALHRIHPITWLKLVLAINARALHAAVLLLVSVYFFPFEKTEMDLLLIVLSAVFGIAAVKKASDALQGVLKLYLEEIRGEYLRRLLDPGIGSLSARERLREEM